MANRKWTCPYCEKEFQGQYWGLSGKAGGYAAVKKTGLPRYNFERHKEACKQKKGWNIAYSDHDGFIYCIECVHKVYKTEQDWEDYQIKVEHVRDYLTFIPCEYCDGEVFDRDYERILT